MINTLRELADYIRQTVPFPRAILQLKENHSAGGVTFIWQGVEFFVKPSLHVLEVRGHSLYITGLSTLLQAVLTKSSHNERTFESAVEGLNEAENIIKIHNNPRGAIQLVQAVKRSLEKMANRASLVTA